jgi:hypothetical protein
MTYLTLDQAQQYIARQSASYGLDPAAVLSVAAGEGLSTAGYAGPHPDPAAGAPNAFAVGPFQLNSAGALGNSPAAHFDSQSASAWAWSTDGIDWALGQIAGVAHGKSGSDAIWAIVHMFERPANPDLSTTNAQGRYPAYYQQYSNIEDITGSAPYTPTPGASTTSATAGASSSSSGGSNTFQLVPGFGPWPGIKISSGFLWAALLFGGGILAIVVGLLIYFHKEIAETGAQVARAAAVAA